MLKTVLFLLAVTMTGTLFAGPVTDSPGRAQTEEQVWFLEKSY